MKYACDKCDTVRDCKHAFGRFWPDKSSSGAGCDHKFSYTLELRRRIPAPARSRRIQRGMFV